MNIYNDDGSRRAPADADKIRLGQGIERVEADTGEPSPQRIMAERAVEALRTAGSWEEAHKLIDAAGYTLKITDSPMDANGRVRWGGYVKDHEGRRVKLSALPKDCSYKALEKRFEGETTKPEKVKAWTANAAKGAARKIFNGSSSLEEAEKKLAERGLSIERQGKTGGYLRFAPGDEGRVKLSSLGGKYSLSSLTKRYTSHHIITHAETMHGKQATVNASSRKDASEHAYAIQNDRASSAQERADAAETKAATASAAAVQAGADGMEGFYELDFFEQVSVMTRVAGVEAAARAATTRASEAEERAREQDARAERAEMALSMSQPHENTQLNDNEEKKMESFQLRILSYNDVRQAVAETIAAAALQDFKRMAHGASWINSALTRERTEYRFRDDVDISDVRGVVEAAQNVSIFADAAEAAEAADAAEMRDLLSKALGELRAEVQKLAPNASTTIDTAADKKAGVGFGKAPTETGLKTEKTAQAAPEKEIQAPRRKFSFGSMLGKKFGATSGPAGGPKM